MSSRAVKRRGVEVSGSVKFEPLTGFAVARAQEVAAGLSIPIMERQIERLTEAAEDVERHAHRLHSLADRLLGMGEQAMEGTVAPAPISAIGKLNEAHERLALARSSLNLAVNRLETL